LICPLTGGEVYHRFTRPEQPFVLVAQQSLFDPTCAPPGQQAISTHCPTTRKVNK
jgi:hypothetical protein